MHVDIPVPVPTIDHSHGMNSPFLDDYKPSTAEAVVEKGKQVLGSYLS